MSSAADAQVITVQITSCKHAGYWYSNKIGQKFRVKPEYYLFSRNEIRKWQVVDTILAIDLSDCNIVEQ